MVSVRVNDPKTNRPFKLEGNWVGEVMGQDFAGRGRMLVWLRPADGMARIEADEEPMDYGEATVAIAANRQDVPPPPLPATSSAPRRPTEGD
jgi:hypothetical protein